MKVRDDAVLDALQRAQPFLDENATALTSVDFTAARKRLDDVEASFSAHALDQDVGERVAKGETAKQLQLRMKLRSEQMQPIAVVARGNLRTVPEFKSLQMPKPRQHGQAFIASARGMADSAAIHKEILVAHGLPSTFLDDFTAGITKLEDSLNEREKSRTKRVGATKGLNVEAKNGRTVLRILDALMQQALSDNEPLLRAWKSARLIRRRPGGNSAPPAPATTSQTAPATAPTLAAVNAA